MSTVKIVLRKKKNKDNTYPLALRITKERKSSYIYLGHSIKVLDWNETEGRVKKSHPNSVRLNNFLLKKLSDATNNLLDLETNRNAVTASVVKKKIKPAAGPTFYAQADAYLERLQKSGKYNQYTADKPRVKHFKEFVGSDIALQEITPMLLEKFKGYVRVRLQLSERSAVNHLVMVRSVFSHAIKDNVIDVKYYPFGKGKTKIKFPESVKIGLSPEEIKSLETVVLFDRKQNHARNLWLFSFYLAGIRISDVLRMRWSDIQDDRLYYAMGKNNKAGSLKMPEKALKIIEHYRKERQTDNDLIFPELRGSNFDDKFTLERTIAFKTSSIDKCLRNHVSPKCGIKKRLTMHIARHTFGNLSGDKIPIQMLQKLYRHSSVTTTIGYQANFIHKDADEALGIVIGY